MAGSRTGWQQVTRRRWTRCILLALLALAAFPAAASAAEITVNTPDDSIDGTTCSLRDALTSANDNNAAGNGCDSGAGPTNTIVLPAGHYTLTQPAGPDDDDNTGGD